MAANDSRGILDFGNNIMRQAMAIFVKGTEAGDTALLGRSDGAIYIEHKPIDADSILATIQNAAGATGNGVAVDMSGYKSITVEIAGTFIATVSFEGTIDGTTWFLVGLNNVTNVTIATSAAAAGVYAIDARSAITMLQFRARISAFTSGTITVRARKHPR